MESGTNATLINNKRVMRVTTTRRVPYRLGVTFTVASVCGTKVYPITRFDKSIEKVMNQLRRVKLSSSPHGVML